MKKIFAYHAMMRVSSILALLALLIVRFSLARSGRSCPGFFLDVLFESLVLSHVVLGMYPDEVQNTRFSFYFSAATVLISCIAGVIGKSSLVAFSMFVVYLAIMVFGPQSKLKLYFKSNSLWTLFENYASFFYICLFLLLTSLFLLSSSIPSKIVLLVILAMLFVLRYVSAFTGWTFLVSKSRECQIKKSICGFLNGVPDADIAEELKLSAVYDRSVKYMEENLPFLDPDYDMEDLAESIFSNKTYVSRAINYYYGKNFRQFLNYYRVMYSIELMKKDPETTVVELAIQSGFNSTVSYNLSFKLVMDNTPMNYCKEFVISSKSPSMKKVPEAPIPRESFLRGE